MRAVAGIHAQDELGAGGGRRCDFGRIKAVDRHPHAPVTQCRHGIADACPGRVGDAAQVDDIGPFGSELLRLPDQFLGRKPGRMVDLGEDLDVMAAISGMATGCLAEEPGQVVEILRALLDRNSAGLFDDRSQIAPAITGQDYPLDVRRGRRGAGQPIWAS